MTNSTKGTAMILSATLIWGVGAVVLRSGMEYMGPFTLTAARFFLGALVTLLLSRLFKGIGHVENDGREKNSRKDMLKAGIICGLVLCVGVIIRQFALLNTTVGRVSFMASLFVIIVPIVGIFFGRAVRRNVWFAMALAVCGMYFLGFNGGLSMNTGDILALICAFAITGHILVLNHFSQNCDIMVLAYTQAFVSSAIAFVLALIFEQPSFSQVADGIWHVLYTGILTSAVAQILLLRALKITDPAVASIMLSTEAVFATTVSWLWLREILSTRELIGCAFLLTAVILSKIQFKRTQIKV